MATWKKIAYATDVLSLTGGTISAIRGTELAPAITEANWVVGAGWVDPVVSGVLDNSSDGAGGAELAIALSLNIGDTYEFIITVVNSPTTGTFVAGGDAGFYYDGDEVNMVFTSVGTYTAIRKIQYDNVVYFQASNSRFGISAISVKKLTEGNLTMDGGQILAGANLVGGVLGYAFEGHPLAGLGYDPVYGSVRIHGNSFDYYTEAGVWLGGLYEDDGFWAEGNYYSSAPTGGTAAGWKLGSVDADKMIEVEVGGDSVLRKIMTGQGGVISANRGTELAPALTEANWDTNVAGWVHPVVGGVLDHGSDGMGVVIPTGVTAIEAGSVYEVTITTTNSPTTGTWVGECEFFLGGDGTHNGYITSAATITAFFKATTTGNISIRPHATDARFGVSAISVKKLSEGNVTTDGGQFLGVSDAIGRTYPSFAFEGHPDSGMGYWDWGEIYLILGGNRVLSAYNGEVDFHDPTDDTWIGGFSAKDSGWGGGIWTQEPTGGTGSNWLLGSVVNNEIEVEVGGDTVKRMLQTSKSIVDRLSSMIFKTNEVVTVCSAFDSTEQFYSYAVPPGLAGANVVSFSGVHTYWGSGAGSNVISLYRYRESDAGTEEVLGDLTTQYDVTNTAGTTFRYTYDTTGTNPNIADSDVSLRVGDFMGLNAGSTFAAGNQLEWIAVTGVGADYFEVDNASGVVESNKTGQFRKWYCKRLVCTVTNGISDAVNTSVDDLKSGTDTYDMLAIGQTAVKGTTPPKGLGFTVEMKFP